ncbi:MAG: hypothetical protein IPG75_20735 [Gemmatimonadetes bacterium]|nr:hypothetical protein [Gemmatimonadota bacterium]
MIGAWCRRQGLSQPQAALLLLRTFWEGEEAEESDAGLGAPAYLDGGSLLSTVDLRRLAKAIWHGEVA